MSDTRRYRGPRRNRKWIRPDLQLKTVLQTLFVTIFALLISFQLALVNHWLLVQQGPANQMDRIPSILLKSFAQTLVIAIPICIAVAIYQSFKFCGPLHRISQFLTGLVDGRWDRKCQVRANDELQDVADQVSRAVETFTGRVKAQQTVLEEARAILSAPTSSFADHDHVDRVLAEIEACDAEYQRRFGPVEVAATTPVAEAEPAEPVTA